MKEEHLHFIWKYQLFETSNLVSTYGEKIELQNLGSHNFDQGPDFNQACVKIGKEIMHGNLELHLRNEDWYSHRHDRDPKYNNVILHIVLEETPEIFTLTSQKTLIPILVLSRYIKPEIITHIDYLMSQKTSIACQDIYQLPDEFQITNFKEILLIERISRKSQWIKELIDKNNNDCESSFYQAILYGFGLKTNADSFLQIAQSLPQKYLAKNIDNRFKLEALLLGQANIIEVCDDYSKSMYEEYQYLRKLYQLHPINTSPLFAKMLPASFPTIRLAQFAGFIYNRKGLYSTLTNFNSIGEIRNYFRTETSEYWNKRYRFGKESSHKGTRLSDIFIDKIIINVILPFLVLIEIEKDQDPRKYLEFYQELKAENNKITREFISSIPIKNETAFDSQSILEWYQYYCVKKNCLHCPIGFQTLKSNKNFSN